MNPSEPPSLAVWLLQHVGPAQDEVLLGDLLEEHALRKSSRWFWRQTVAAILLCGWRDAIRHWPLVAAALVVGWTVLALPVSLWIAGHWFVRHDWIGWAWMPNPGGSTQLAVALVSGLIVARLFAEVRAGAVLSLAFSVVVLGWIGVEELFRIGAPRTAIAGLTWAFLIYAIGIVAGGFTGRRGPGVIGLSQERAVRQGVDRLIDVLRPMRKL